MKEFMPKKPGRAKFVKLQREERAWPQAQLATIAGVDIRTIQRLEKDGAASFETLKGVASAFDINVKELIQISRPKESPNPPKKVHFMPRLLSGKDLTSVVCESDQFQFEHDEAHDPRSLSAMKGILELLKEDVVRLYDADPVKRLQVESELSQEIKGLENYGFYLFGIKRVIPRIADEQKTLITMCTIFMSHSQSPKIIKDKKLSMVIPATLTEIAK